jgi:hypothetical protein
MIKSWTILFAVFVSLGGAAAVGAHTIPVPTPQRQLVADNLVFSKLQTLVLVHFDHTPLSKAIESLADAAGVNAFVDWHSLAQDAVRAGTPVTLQFNGPVSVRTVLSFLEAQLSNGGSRPAMTVSHGVLFFGTIQAVQTHRVTRVYTVLSGPLAQAVTRKGAMQRRRLVQIVQLLQNNIDRNRWIDNGGIDASATIFHGLLIVTADENMQRRIEKLLQRVADALDITEAAGQR